MEAHTKLPFHLNIQDLKVDLFCGARVQVTQHFWCRLTQLWLTTISSFSQPKDFPENVLFAVHGVYPTPFVWFGSSITTFFSSLLFLVFVVLFLSYVLLFCSLCFVLFWKSSEKMLKKSYNKSCSPWGWSLWAMQQWYKHR